MDCNSVTRQVLLYLRQQLQDGAWPVGSKIPTEKELCAQTETSRTSVRGALQQLNVLGLLETRHGAGTFVRSTDVRLLGDTLPRDAITGDEKLARLRQWNEARLMLEPSITYYVAERATPELLERLESLNEEQRAAVGNQKEFIRIDMQFHTTLADSLENEYISAMIRELLCLEEASLLTNQKMGYHGGVYYHAAITDAIRKKDAAKAKRIMKEHAKDRLTGAKGEEE